MFKKYFSLNNLSTLLLYFSILAFTISFNFSDHRSGGWHQQFLPNLNGRAISDVIFTDSLNGYVTAKISFDHNYIFRTTDGGDNWFLSDSLLSQLTKLQFLNQNIGYVCGSYLYKTTNAGINWINVNTSGIVAQDMSVLNEDTIWVIDSDGLVGGVYRTTDGGSNWTRQLNLGTLNPDHIYMFNKDIGFICEQGSYVRKTTDGGQSWFIVVNNESFTDIHFIDSLTGWKTNGTIKKTSNGGLDWITQTLPQGVNINLSSMTKFTNVNADTIWGVGGRIAFPNNQIRGIIYKTINGGENWGYQIPDTSIKIFQYININSIHKQNIWSYSGITGVHTISGGDTTFYTGIQQLVSVIPENFILKQNYPNPFNPKTVIPFSLKKSSYVKLTAYDIRGREVQRLVDGMYEAGDYEVDFMGKYSPSGVYFYRMEAEDTQSGKIFTETKSMILVK